MIKALNYNNIDIDTCYSIYKNNIDYLLNDNEKLNCKSLKSQQSIISKLYKLYSLSHSTRYNSFIFSININEYKNSLYSFDTDINNIIDNINKLDDEGNYEGCKTMVFNNCPIFDNELLSMVSFKMSEIALKYNNTKDYVIFIKISLSLDIENGELWYKWIDYSSHNENFEYILNIFYQSMQNVQNKEKIIALMIDICDRRSMLISGVCIIDYYYDKIDTMSYSSKKYIYLKKAMIEWKLGNVKNADIIIGNMLKEHCNDLNIYSFGMLFYKNTNPIKGYNFCFDMLRKNRYTQHFKIKRRLLRNLLQIVNTIFENKVENNKIPLNREKYLHSFLPRFMKSVLNLLENSFVWQFFVYIADIYLRNGNIKYAKKYINKAVNICRKNQRWKVWNNVGLIYMKINNYNESKYYFDKAMSIVPDNKKSIVSFNYSLIENKMDNYELSRDRLLESIQYSKNKDMGPYLVHLYIRNQKYKDGKEYCIYNINNGYGKNIGKYVSLLIRIYYLKYYQDIMKNGKYSNGYNKILNIYEKYIEKCDKSPEVYCEMARLMTSTSQYQRSKNYIDIGMSFIPLYTDLIIELLRLNAVYFKSNMLYNTAINLYIKDKTEQGDLWKFIKEDKYEVEIKTIYKIQEYLDSLNGKKDLLPLYSRQYDMFIEKKYTE